MKVPKDAQLAIAIGFAAFFLFVGLGAYGIYYFFTGGCDENSEPYSAYEVREKIEAEYDFPVELEYLGETVTKDKPWKRVDYAFRDKERDFTFTAHAKVAPINASIPFIILPGGRSYYTDYPARCLDRLNDKVQECAKKRGLRFITPEEKAAHLGYQGGVDTVFLTDEKQLADAADEQHLVVLIVTAVATPLHWAQLGEFLFPVAQHVGLDATQLADFTDGEVTLGRNGRQDGTGFGGLGGRCTHDSVWPEMAPAFSGSAAAGR